MNKLFQTQSVLLILIALTYSGLTLYALVRWNEAVSLVLVTGFALMAQEAVKGFFAWLHNQDKDADGKPDSEEGKP